MRRTLLLLLLPALLLCSACASGAAPAATPEPTPTAEPTPEPTPEPDARELWRQADAMYEEYDSIDRESVTHLTISLPGASNTVVIETRFKADGLQGDSPRLQSVTTGDSTDEYRYLDGRLYLDNSLGAYCADMSPEDALEYLMEDAISFVESGFGDVQLVSQEGGYTLAFSEPTEEFIADYARTTDDLGMELKDRFLEVIGNVFLDAEGHFISAEMDISGTYTLADMEIPMTGHISETVISHDRNVTITAPSKLEDYTLVKNIRAPQAMFDAFTALLAARCVDFDTSLTFDALILADPTPYQEDMTGLLYIGEDGSYHYRSEWETFLNSAPQSSEALDYTDTGITYNDNGNIQHFEADHQLWLDALSNDLYAFATPQDIYNCLDMDMEEAEDGSRVIHFIPDTNVIEALFEYALQYVATGWENGTLDYGEASGLLALDAEGLPRTLVLAMDPTVTDSTGGTASGPLVYTVNFNAFGDDVDFPEDFIPQNTAAA